jgi:hypothetical protein
MSAELRRPTQNAEMSVDASAKPLLILVLENLIKFSKISPEDPTIYNAHIDHILNPIL